MTRFALALFALALLAGNVAAQCSCQSGGACVCGPTSCACQAATPEDCAKASTRTVKDTDGSTWYVAADGTWFRPSAKPTHQLVAGKIVPLTAAPPVRFAPIFMGGGCAGGSCGGGR